MPNDLELTQELMILEMKSEELAKAFRHLNYDIAAKQSPAVAQHKLMVEHFFVDLTYLRLATKNLLSDLANGTKAG